MDWLFNYQHLKKTVLPHLPIPQIIISSLRMFHSVFLRLGCRHVILAHCSLTGIFFVMYLFLIIIYENLEKHTSDCFKFTHRSEWWQPDPAHLGSCVRVIKCRQPRTSFVQLQRNLVKISSHPSPERCCLQALPMPLAPVPQWTSSRVRLMLIKCGVRMPNWRHGWGWYFCLMSSCE